MLTLIALSAALLQHPPAPPVPPAPPEVRTRIMLMGAEGPGGLDKDGDGQITREEIMPRLVARPAAAVGQFAARVKQLDKDGDGKFQKDELPPRMQEHFDKLDSDGDGAVSLQELQAGYRKIFAGQKRDQIKRKKDDAK